MKIDLAFITLVFSLFAICPSARGLPNPLHASCELDWNVGVDCASASKKVISQIDKWKGDDCGTSEKCLYTFGSFDGTTLKAKHTTPKAHYVDDLTMTFKTSGTDCAIHGKSSSETWYAVLDKGTNYCNLHNLITGSGLSKQPRFKETTDNWKCTQYSSAQCDKY